MGITVFAKGNVQCESCNIATYRRELVEQDGDQGFAEFLSRELHGPQTEVHLTYGTWLNILRNAKLDQYDHVSGEIDPEELGVGLSNAMLAYRIAGDKTGLDVDFLRIVGQVVNKARELGTTVVWC